ncbi:MAG: TRAFs-binding domain-containing protein [Bacteroidota bacterium]|nr:TRAFs-binding domain-containing protein [Bacteroidota bacterium]
MSDESKENDKGTCFVVMGFGKKTDFESGRTLDLDKSYKNMIKPAVEAAGLKCIRADEIVHSGIIDVPMYEQLLNADVVVADLSTANKNAFYELGIRHALRPYNTIVICEDQAKTPPFDVNHILIRQYHHLGEDIGFDDVMKFRSILTAAITEVYDKNPRDNDSPVYTFLKDLNPPVLAAVKNLIDAAENSKGNSDSANGNSNGLSHSALMQMVDEAVKNEEWLEAKTFISKARKMQQANKQSEDPYLLQRMALITYKSQYPGEKEALEEAKQLLSVLEPATSNDTETLGIWGAIHKRLHEITQDPTVLSEAIRAYERGFYIRNDYYNGINFAYLLNVRCAASTDHAEAIADFVQARRVRMEVKTICEKWLNEQKEPVDAGQMNAYWKSRYWVQASLAEAYLGLGDEHKANALLTEAYSNTSKNDSWMQKTTSQQIAKLKPLLEKSPMAFVQ